VTGRWELPGAGERGVALVLTLMVLLTLTGLALALLSVSAFARYFTPEGDQVGRGPLPPRVGTTTLTASTSPNNARWSVTARVPHSAAT